MDATSRATGVCCHHAAPAYTPTLLLRCLQRRALLVVFTYSASCSYLLLATYAFRCFTRRARLLPPHCASGEPHLPFNTHFRRQHCLYNAMPRCATHRSPAPATHLRGDTTATHLPHCASVQFSLVAPGCSHYGSGYTIRACACAPTASLALGARLDHTTAATVSLLCRSVTSAGPGTLQLILPRAYTNVLRAPLTPGGAAPNTLMCGKRLRQQVDACDRTTFGASFYLDVTARLQQTGVSRAAPRAYSDALAFHATVAHKPRWLQRLDGCAVL